MKTEKEIREKLNNFKHEFRGVTNSIMNENYSISYGEIKALKWVLEEE